MTIRANFIFVNILLFLFLSIAAISVLRSVISPAFLYLEERAVAEKMRLALESIDLEVSSLDEIYAGLARGDGMEILPGAYTDNSLINSCLESGRINLVCFFNGDGTLAWGRSYDPETKGALYTDILNVGASSPLVPFLLNEDADGEGMVKSGAVDTSEGPMILMARSIPGSKGNGLSGGVFVAGRLLTPRVTALMEEVSGVNLEIGYPLTEEKIRAVRGRDKVYNLSDSILYATASGDLIHASVLYKDISGAPLFAVSFSLPGDIALKGAEGISRAWMILTASMFIFVATACLFLWVRVINPLNRVTGYALRLGTQKADHPVPPDLDRRDEVGVLARGFDVMRQALRERTGELERAGERLEQLSQVDGLTGIADRRMFDRVMERVWRGMIREKRPLSLILADVDHFRKYNDIHGRQAGDRCLVEVARIIAQNAQRPEDLCARYAGEEFALILPDTDEEGAFFIAEKIRKAVLEPDIRRDPDICPTVTMSLGLCTIIPQQGDELGDFIRNADHALYFAKETGRNRTVIFSRLPDVFPGK